MQKLIQRNIQKRPGKDMTCIVYKCIIDTWFLQKQTQNYIQRGLVFYTNVSLKHGFCKNKYKITFKEARQRHGQGLYCKQMYHEYTVSLTPALCHRVGTNDHIRQ